jgi:C-terminal processing protease CtpA/Prc
MRVGKALRSLLVAALVLPTTAATQQVVQVRAPKGWIGISYDSEQFATWLAAGSPGEFSLIIERVWEGSPAAVAGLQPGDRILRLQGAAPTPEVFTHLAETLRPGERIGLICERDGLRREVDVVAAARPEIKIVAPPEEMLVKIDSVRNAIFERIEILRSGEEARGDLRVRMAHPEEGEGTIRLRIRGDSIEIPSLVITGEEPYTTLRIERIPREEGRDITWMYSFHIPELGEALPFEALLVESERVEELKLKLRELREAAGKARRAELERTRELASAPRREEERIDPEEELLRPYREARETYERQVEQASKQLEEVSRQELLRRGGVLTGTVVEPEHRLEFRPLTPYVLGARHVAGAQVTPLNDQLSEYFSVAHGLLITEVLEGTPAKDAGLAAGDIIVRAAGRPVASMADLRDVLYEPGTLQLTIIRKGTTTRVTLER